MDMTIDRMTTEKLQQIRNDYQERIDALDVAISTLTPFAGYLSSPDNIIGMDTVCALQQMRQEYQRRADHIDCAVSVLSDPHAAFSAAADKQQPKQTARKGRRKAEAWTDPGAGTYPSVQIDPDTIPDYNTSGRGGIRLDR